MSLADFFLKIDGAPGESHDAKHKDEIQLLSFSFGESNAGTMQFGGGGGAGKVVMQDFHFVMNVNKASPALLGKCATGEHLKSAILTCRKAGKEQQEFLKVKFTDLLVSSFQTGGSSHSNHLPTDQISLNFTKVEWEYKPQNPDGNLGASVKSGFDLKTMKPV